MQIKLYPIQILPLQRISILQIVQAGKHLILQTESTDAVFIRNNGKVGIGTSSPGRILDVKNNDSEVYQLRLTGGDTTNTSGLEFTSGDGSYQVAALQAGDSTLSAYTAGAERLRIDGNGNVGIGTDLPQGNCTLVLKYPF